MNKDEREFKELSEFAGNGGLAQTIGGTLGAMVNKK